MTLQLVRAEEWRPPPQAVVFGELHADGAAIVLICQGNGYDAQTIGTRLSALTPAVKVVDKANGIVSVPCTWVSVTQLAASFPGTPGQPRWVPGPRLCAWIVDELTRRSAQAPLIAEFPDGQVLRPYQEAGARMIAAAGRFLLCDSPGVGKTCTTIAGLLERKARGTVIFPMVIIVPSWSVADVWQREIAAWAPGWRTVMWGGPGRDIGKALDQAGILISTYATARVDANNANGPLVKLNPAAVVLDEAHMIKSAALTTVKGNSTVSAAARRIAAHADTVAGLTGTPVTKDTGDIFTALSAMDAASWPSRERFVRRYCETSPGEYEETITGLKQLAAPEFFACLTGAMRRVDKADVLDQLPPKVYSVRRVKLPDDWRRAYDDLERDMLAELPGGEELSLMDTLSQLTFLVQIASAAADVEITEGPEEDPYTGKLKKHYHAVLKAPSWKVDELLEILAERRGQPVAVFAPSRQLIEVAGRACEKTGYRTGYITGTTSRGDRARAIDDFQAGKLDVILATTGAGGTGITLTAAGTVVFLQRPWSLAESLQAEDRAYRWGSEIHECVEIIDVVAVNTVEDRVRAALQSKAGMLSEVIRDPRVARNIFGGSS